MDGSRPLHGLAERVRDARSRMRLTQADFAERMAVTPLTVHRWETGQSRPRALALDRLRALEEAIASRGADARSGGPSGGPAPSVSVPLDFAGDPAAVLLVAEAHRLAHGHQFNAAFASETARIDPLPHQRIAVYERMLKQEPLRFLLADDAGAGKTIMTGLYMREMLFRRRIRRVLIVTPAGLVGNWERELRTLFRLQCRIVSGADVRAGANPFSGPDGDRVVVSLDTLANERAFAALRSPEVAPYDLVVFDEAHKLSASRTGSRVTTTRRYRLAEALAGAAPSRGGSGPAASGDATGGDPFAGLSWAARHLLLLTATPHMGKESPWFHLWRLLDHHAFGAPEALRRYPPGERQRHFIRRTKEEMVDLEGNPLYRQRECRTFSFDLSGGEDGEHALYLRTTAYLREHYGRALRNRPAVQLAMSVFQRRLASSTSALLRSFERRIEKIERDVADWRSGRLDAALLRRRQQALSERYREDFFEAHGADDDAREGGPERGGEPGERSGDFEDAVLGAVTAVGIEELRAEAEALRGLRDRARALVAAGDESKFEKLREVLEDPLYAREKWLVFSEHRDTVDFLVRRIEGLGHAGQVAVIHGGMAWPEREAAVERFRQPDGAHFLVATDAAGEGINLQFCRLMVNYDVPWNPARLEQRMGRIHRYGQKHDVRVVNLVAGGTHEGRVLKVLLEKLENVRRVLRSDKVFDVIGRLLENVSLREYMTAALDPGREREREQGILEDVERAVTGSAVRRLAEAEASVYGPTGEVAPRVDGMRRELDRERYLHLLPAYVRLFVESAARKLGIGLQGDLDGVFSLVPATAGALDPLLPALEGYPPEVRRRLRIRRPDAGEACIWLHPGEPVFDALCRRVIDRFSHDARRGAIFIDPRAEEPALWHLAAASVEDDPSGTAALPGEPAGPAPTFTASSRAAAGGLPGGPTEPAGPTHPAFRRSLESRLIALRQGGGVEETLAEPSPDALLALHPAPGVAPGSVPLAGRATALRAGAAAHIERGLSRAVEEHRTARRAELPERRRRLNVGFDLRAAALAKRRSALARAAADPAADEDVAALKREQAALSGDRVRALRALDAAADRIVAAPPRFLAHALALPPFPGSDVERMDERVEAVAVRVAAQAEADRGAEVQDVSTPEKARAAGLSDWPGFDLLSRHPNGEVRSIEVKGRAGRAAVRMELNEWKQACNLGGRYWLYAVFDCATPAPQLYRVRDPFWNLLASEHAAAAFTLTAGSIVRAAEPETPSPGTPPSGRAP